MKNGLAYITWSLVGAVALGIVIGTLMSSRSITAADEIKMKQLPQVIRSVPIAEKVDLGGERVPIDRFDVKERLDRELMVNSYWHSNTIQAIKLSNRFFPVIEPILAEEGVPDDFKYLAVAESDLRLKTSYAGAKGYWQFMKASGKQYGLEINDEVDERYHIERSTRAAAKYIKDLYDRFGSWTAAAAAYNMGPTRLKRITSEQSSKNYFDLNLNDETSRYVFRVLAFKYILQDPESYGFYIQPEEKYKPLNDYYIVRVDQSVNDWAKFASDYRISYRDLKVYNPWLIDRQLTVINNTYHIKIPM